MWSYDPAAASNAWQQKASAPTSFRAHQAVVYNGEMYIHTFTQSLWRYKPGEDNWDYITPQNTIPARLYQTAVQTGDEILVFGGQDVDGNEYRGAWAYNFVTNAWTERTTMPYSLTRAAGTLVTTTLGKSIQADAGPVVAIFGGLSNGVSGDRTLFFYPEGARRWEIIGEMRVYLPLVVRNKQ